MNLSLNESPHLELEHCPPGSILDEPTVKWTFIGIYIFVFVCCLMGNLLILFVVLTHREMRSATNFFLANLAVADLLVAVFCILQNMIQILVFESARWPLGSLLCHIYVFVLQLVPCTSAGILMLVSIEKYIAVLHPLFARNVLTPQLRISCTALTWLISIVASCPYYQAANFISYTTIEVCSRKTYTFRIYQTISFVMWYICPVTALAFLYTRIGYVLRKSAASGIVASNQVSRRATQNRRPPYAKCTNSEAVELGSVASHGDVVQEQSTVVRNDGMHTRRRAVRLLFAIVLSFALLTLPQHVRMLYYSWRETYTHCNSSTVVLFQPISYLCLFLNSAINPFLYAFLSERFRKSIKDVMGCKTQRERDSRKMMLRTMVSDVQSTPNIRRRAAETMQ